MVNGKMAEGTVKLRVTSNQLSDGGERFHSRSELTARYYYQNDVLTYVYREPEMGDTETVLRVEKEGVRLTRQGEVKHELFFARDKVWEASYITPYGSFPLWLKATEVLVTLTGVVGNIKLKYELSAGGGEAVEFEVNIEIEGV